MTEPDHAPTDGTNQDRPAEAELSQLMEGLCLYDLVGYDGRFPRAQRVLDEVLANRCELTLEVGLEACHLGRNSLLWHDFQNVLVQYRGGWYDTLHRSYLSTETWLSSERLQYIVHKLPRVTVLNLMVDYTTIPVERLSATVVQIGQMLRTYGPRLRTLRLWFRAHVRQENDGWSSILRSSGAPSIWSTFEQMIDLQDLWLHVDEIGPIDHPQPPVCPLADLLLNEHFDGMLHLKDFRYASNSFDPYRTIEQSIASKGSISSIHVVFGSSYQALSQYSLNESVKYREIGALLGSQGIGRMQSLFLKFQSLTRLCVTLEPRGPHFLELFKALAQVTELYVLHVNIVQASLFSPADVQSIRHHKPAPLSRLHVLTIKMVTTYRSCTVFSLAPLFAPMLPVRQTETEEVRQGTILHPLPQLQCFDFEISAGRCRRHRNQDLCVNKALFDWITRLVRDQLYFVQFTNHSQLPTNTLHTVELDGLRAPESWPVTLH